MENRRNKIMNKIIKQEKKYNIIMENKFDMNFILED